mgnify:CR=1 FL=1
MKPSEQQSELRETEDLVYGQTAWGCAQMRKRLDSEAMMTLRASLTEPLRKAQSWPSLRDLLKGKGFDVMARAGHLRLVDLQSRVEICTFGLLGGFTPFSAFSLDTLTLWERGNHAEAGLYVGLSVTLSLAAIGLGVAFARVVVPQ